MWWWWLRRSVLLWPLLEDDFSIWRGYVWRGSKILKLDPGVQIRHDETSYTRQTSLSFVASTFPWPRLAPGDPRSSLMALLVKDGFPTLESKGWWDTIEFPEVSKLKPDATWCLSCTVRLYVPHTYTVRMLIRSFTFIGIHVCSEEGPYILGKL